ncbi:hypothetical protein LZK98_08260 [Sphingomonas cannabina]|uniref:hypothetical protein n=1 Tax=Sphingomonas cannabina TaxID=2899123 RepID=UPI001F3A0660|nr:hypothetical protein [Sphingomonas cannabina]UIJ46922.1 hypothetical protein LZK98_08260 [Sphingomonas cannabina]
MPEHRPNFETDLDPVTRQPRVRFNFANGWTASIVVRTDPDGFDAMIASVAACPTGRWGTGATEICETEAFPDEAIDWLLAIRCRPPVQADTDGEDA